MNVISVPGVVGVVKARLRSTTVILIDDALPSRVVRELARLVCTAEECASLESVLRSDAPAPTFVAA